MSLSALHDHTHSAWDTDRARRFADLGIVELSRYNEPEARRYRVADLVPADATTSLYADGGSGKSLLAVHLASHVALGQPWLGLEVGQSPVLYVDAELDVAEFGRRAYRVARGIGLERPPAGLHYLRVEGSLIDDAQIDRVEQALAITGAGLMVIDSLMAATAGADLERSHDTVSLFTLLRRWGTVLAIDHVPKLQAGGNFGQSTQFGSVFKRNLSRSALQLIQADAGGLWLRQTKHNFGPKAAPVGIGMEFGAGVVSIERMAIGDDRLSGITDHLPALERVARELGQHPAGITPDELATGLELSSKTVRNYLTTLRQQKRARSDSGRWLLCEDNSQIPNPLGVRNLGIENPKEIPDQAFCSVCGKLLPLPEDRERGYHTRCASAAGPPVDDGEFWIDS
ncbi:MAG: AAA family ATPase [Thermomicrobiales bacterium]